ncbi:MAG: PAS domain S-box protein, partial [Desulfobacteraceae bacterium]|nr:PAS domain S-box protein [Desulfobacteraceae bacterium]
MPKKPTYEELEIRIQELEQSEFRLKQAEEALRKSEATLQSILTAAPVGIGLIRGKDRAMIWSNNKMTNLIGYDQEEFRGKSARILYESKEEFLRVGMEIAKGMDHSNIGKVETRIVRRDGISFDACSYTARIDPMDEASDTIVIMFDITESKQAKEALEKSEERFRSLVESLNEWVWETDPKGIYTYVSPQISNLLGYPSEEIIGKTVYDIVLPEDKERVMQTVNSILKKPRAFENLEKRCRHRDGHLVILETSGVPIIDKTGNFFGFKGINRDITERKKALKEVQQLNQFRESIIENANIWLNVLDEKGNVVIWNKAAETISGYVKEEVVGHQEIWEWVYPNKRYRDRIFAKALKIIEGHESVEGFSTTITRKDGDKRIISWNSRNLVDDRGEPVGSIALGRDITNRKR